MALTNKTFPGNLVRNSLGFIDSWQPEIIPNVDQTQGSRSLCFLLSGGARLKVKRIDYSVNGKAFTGSTNAQDRMLGRLAVIRNVSVNPANVLFDPLITDSTYIDASSTGVNWQVPRFNWNAADIVFERFIGSQGTTLYDRDAIDVDFSLTNESDNLLVVLTPFYGNQAPGWAGSPPPPTILVAVGTFLGTQPPTGSNQESFNMFRTLGVSGAYC